MKNDPQATRRALLDVATHLFSERGIASVSLNQINAAAGQRNATALQYHFGSRSGLLRALLVPYVERISEQRTALLAEAATRPGDVRAAARVFVEPLARLLTADGWHGRAFLCINAEINTNLRSHRPEILELHRATAGLDAYQRLWSAHDLSSPTPVPSSLRDERTRVGAMMLLHALADQARLWSGTEPSADDGAGCAANLTDMFLGATLAPSTLRDTTPSS